MSPRVVLSAAAVLIVASILLSPADNPADESDALTTFSYGATGVRGLHDAAERLGWRAERREIPMRAPLDSGAVYVVLTPAVPLTTAEVSALLDAVRRGAGLLFVPSERSLLADSLRVRRAWALRFPAVAAQRGMAAARGELPLPAARADAAAPDSTLARAPTPPDDHPGDDDEDDEREDEFADSAAAETESGPPRRRRPAIDTAAVRRAAPDAVWANYRLRLRAPAPADTVTFLESFGFSGGNPLAGFTPAPVALGFGVGRGRVVALADPTILRNQALRAGAPGVYAVRMLEWAGRDSRRVVFDEYHQGFGPHADISGAVSYTLAHTAPGRAVLALVVAALLLLLAVGSRPIPPAARARFERRSPLEHVGALAQAYEQIAATRLVARRLVQGVRRRHAAGAAHVGSDEAFLAALAARYPALRGEVELLRAAIERPLPPAGLAGVGRAIATIERTIAT